MSEHQLDVRRLLCPLPVIKVQNRIKDCQEGDILEVFCTDPGTLQDIPTWCRIYHHEVLEIKQSDHEIIFKIRKGMEPSVIARSVATKQ